MHRYFAVFLIGASLEMRENEKILCYFEVQCRGFIRIKIRRMLHYIQLFLHFFFIFPPFFLFFCLFLT